MKTLSNVAKNNTQNPILNQSFILRTSSLQDFILSNYQVLPYLDMHSSYELLDTTYNLDIDLNGERGISKGRRTSTTYCTSSEMTPKFHSLTFAKNTATKVNNVSLLDSLQWSMLTLKHRQYWLNSHIKATSRPIMENGQGLCECTFLVDYLASGRAYFYSLPHYFLGQMIKWLFAKITPE